MTDAPRRGLPPAGRFALTAALCSSVGQTFFIGLFGAEFRAAFGLSDAAFGTLYSSATLVSGLTVFWLGAVADHVALRRIAVVVALVLAAGAAVVATAATPLLFACGLFLLRLAGQGLLGHLAVVAAGRFATVRRGRALAMASYGFIVGEALFPFALALALESLHWRAVWWSLAAVAALVVAPLLYVLARPLVGDPSAEGDGDTPVAPPRIGRGRLLVDPTFLRILAVVLVPPVVVTALFLHQAAIAERQGWAMLAVGQAFALFAAAQFAASFAAGRLIDRFGVRPLLRIELVPLGLALLALGGLAPGPSLWAMFAGLGLTAGLNSVLAAAVWVEFYGTRQLGLVRGVYMALMVVSTALGPVALGLLLDAGVALWSIGLVVAGYAALVPPLATPGRTARRR
ncbi:MFS transporter [Wenzhouxiangella sp. XN79A]|uniref:MFS transporter n=1 Tax=Wenzhouxiangella sp. XN79A TaxID=2724193 RepID=UPI00144A62C9|nr:MFS transporter [Wenzhouxiangella sp. XN79A]NKI36030.1 MFS transporter [Wenzhouxiangella sp. XN79A]